MEDSFWITWIGLPAIEGADPRAGVGGCCFRMAGLVRKELGMHWPDDKMDQWYEMAFQRRWEELLTEWRTYTKLSTATPGAISLIDRGLSDMSFGVGVLANPRVLLTTIPRSGVVAVPRSVWRTWTFYEVVQ